MPKVTAVVAPASLNTISYSGFFSHKFHCIYNGFLEVWCLCGVISQRWRNESASILGVSATQEIVFRCYRTNEEHVPFQWLIMAELWTVFLSLWDSNVAIHLTFGELSSQIPLHFQSVPRGLMFMWRYLTAMEE